MFRSRRAFVLLGPLLTLAGIYGYSWIRFPSDRTPEGAYLRVVKAVNRGKPEEFFAYIEEAAQHACFTIRDYRKNALGVAKETFPKDRFVKLRSDYGNFADAADGAEVFALVAREQGWLEQLRHDVSGVSKVRIEGPRATVVTAKGTRYAMRVRPNGIWGMTAFTPTLSEEAQHAARDLDQIEKASRDYERAKKASRP